MNQGGGERLAQTRPQVTGEEIIGEGRLTTGEAKQMLHKRPGERIAHEQPMVKKGQRQPLGVGLNPERKLRQFKRQRVLVHPIQTMHRDQAPTDRLGDAP